MQAVGARFLRPSLDWLLALVPVAGLLAWLAPGDRTLVFVASGLAIVPLARWMGEATEQLASHAGEGIGGLLNATFGNAAELIIALSALARGLDEVVKASLTGSILGNLLLVLGMAIAAGGFRRDRQRFQAVAARAYSTMLLLAAVGLVLPAAYHHLGGAAARGRESDLSLEIAIVLIATYAATLLFSLRTHKRLFTAEAEERDAGAAQGGGGGPAGGTGWSLVRAFVVLVVATGLVAWMSEILVGSVEAAAPALGMSELFVGVVVVAVIGNAAEHATAVKAAIDDRMDLALGIAIGSSVQVALFVAPVLVFASYALGPRPMDLVFSPAEVLAVVMAVLVAGQVAGDGESNWLEGVQLLAVYAILAMVFYFLPA